MPTLTILKTTIPDTLEQAEEFAKTLLEKKVATCVQISHTHTSLYPWEGKIEVSKELVLEIKTLPSHLDACVSLIKNIHPYEVPEIIHLEVDSKNQQYHDWAKENLK